MTRYAHKNYGWDKWDLANIANLANGASFTGSSTYSFLLSLNQDISPAERASYTALGVFTLTSGMASVYIFNKLNQYQRQTEIHKLLYDSSSIKMPQFSPRRPLIIYLGALSITAGGSFLQRETLFSKTAGLFFVCLGFSYEFLSAYDYFRTQFPTPPSTKKPFWKTTYERIKNKFKPKPHLEPAAEPAAQYATIDSLIA